VADAKCRAVSDASGTLTDELEAAEDEMGEVQERFSACARRVLKEPVHNQSDLMLLAEATYWWLYTVPSGLWAPGAEAQLAGSPAHVIGEGSVCEEAVVALLKGVRDVGMPAAISVPVAPLNAAREKYLASDWHRIVSTFLEEFARPENRTDDARDGLKRHLCDETNAIWAKPVRTWDDLIVRAAIAVHWNGDNVLPYPNDVISGNENFDYRALAHVVRGILDLAGLKFDADGRLL
jgi:hypothetical protein